MLVEDAVASAPEALAQNLLFFVHGANPSDRPAIHAADTGRLPDARLVGARNGAHDRAYGSSGGGPGAGMLP